MAFEFESSVLEVDGEKIAKSVNQFDYNDVYNFVHIYNDAKIVICCRDNLVDINISSDERFIFDNHEFMINLKTAILMGII
jgi:predicted NACHT family NTPase